MHIEIFKYGKVFKIAIMDGKDDQIACIDRSYVHKRSAVKVADRMRKMKVVVC